MLTSEGKSALIHKSSVNLINKDPKFPSPFFVFGEKVSVYSTGILLFLLENAQGHRHKLQQLKQGAV